MQPSGGTARLIAEGQSIHFEDKSEDYDTSQVMDGTGGTVEDFINTHGWWFKEAGGAYGASIGTASSLDWTPPASGKIYIIKKESDDQTPVVTEDAAAYCYMKFDVRDVDYVTVTPNPGYVAVLGGTLVLTGHAWDDSGTPDNTADDVELAATFDWTVDPVLGTLAPASGKTSTLTAGANPGTCTVTATHQPSGKSGTATVYVVKVVQDNDLWWFDGENAANYHEEVTLTAQGAATGTFKWDVTAGADRVDLNNGGADADTITATNDNTVQVKSTAASTPANDVSITLTISGVQICTHALTVYAPTSAVVIGQPDDNPWDNGYTTEYTMEVRDQFGVVLAREIEVNEDYGAWVSDYAGENWPPTPPNGTMTINIRFIDTYGIHGSFVPMPVNPGDPGSNVKVDHAPQWYRAGSQTPGDGRLIKTHTFQGYRGKGRQE